MNECDFFNMCQINALKKTFSFVVIDDLISAYLRNRIHSKENVSDLYGNA